MTNFPESPAPAAPPLKTLTYAEVRDRLAAALAPAPDDPHKDVLRRQVEALDGLFHYMLAQGLGSRFAGAEGPNARPDYIRGDYLALALRAQQQCVGTARTLTAAEYMKSLSPPLSPRSPQPSLSARRTAGADDDDNKKSEQKEEP